MLHYLFLMPNKWKRNVTVKLPPRKRQGVRNFLHKFISTNHIMTVSDHNRQNVLNYEMNRTGSTDILRKPVSKGYEDLIKYKIVHGYNFYGVHDQRLVTNILYACSRTVTITQKTVVKGKIKITKHTNTILVAKNEGTAKKYHEMLKHKTKGYLKCVTPENLEYQYQQWVQKQKRAPSLRFLFITYPTKMYANTKLSRHLARFNNLAYDKIDFKLSDGTPIYKKMKTRIEWIS